jgi:outer membrane lipoprotein-sorting protein
MNLRKIALLFFALFVGNFSLAHAQTPLLDQVRQKYHAKASVEAEFGLTINWNVREKIENRNGRLLFAAGDKFRVELDNTVWVCDGQTFWQYSAATNQVIIKRLLDVDLSTHPSQILSTYLNKYQYALKEENDKQAVLAWKADSAGVKNPYQSITLVVDKKEVLVNKLVVVDRSGNESTYTFKKTKFGITPPPGSFEFEVPAGARILDTRE